MFFYVLCFLLCAVICSIVPISDCLFVRSLIFIHLCVYVNQAAHVNLISINENDDDDDDATERRTVHGMPVDDRRLIYSK